MPTPRGRWPKGLVVCRQADTAAPHHFRASSPGDSNCLCSHASGRNRLAGLPRTRRKHEPLCGPPSYRPHQGRTHQGRVHRLAGGLGPAAAVPDRSRAPRRRARISAPGAPGGRGRASASGCTRRRPSPRSCRSRPTPRCSGSLPAPPQSPPRPLVTSPSPPLRTPRPPLCLKPPGPRNIDPYPAPNTLARTLRPPSLLRSVPSPVTVPRGVVSPRTHLVHAQLREEEEGKRVRGIADVRGSPPARPRPAARPAAAGSSDGGPPQPAHSTGVGRRSQSLGDSGAMQAGDAPSLPPSFLPAAVLGSSNLGSVVLTLKKRVRHTPPPPPPPLHPTPTRPPRPGASLPNVQSCTQDSRSPSMPHVLPALFAWHFWAQFVPLLARPPPRTPPSSHAPLLAHPRRGQPSQPPQRACSWLTPAPRGGRASTTWCTSTSWTRRPRRRSCAPSSSSTTSVRPPLNPPDARYAENHPRPDEPCRGGPCR